MIIKIVQYVVSMNFWAYWSEILNVAETIHAGQQTFLR